MEVREQRGRDGKGGGPDGRASGMQEQRLAASQVRMVWGRYGGPGWGGGRGDDWLEWQTKRKGGCHRMALSQVLLMLSDAH